MSYEYLSIRDCKSKTLGLQIKNHIAYFDLQIRINKTKCKKCLILNSQSLDWRKFSVFEEFRTIGGKTENTRNMRAYYGAETLFPSALEGKIPCLQKIGF